MGEWRKITPKLCSKCYYYRGGKNTIHTCDYIGVEMHSRIFENGKRKELSKQGMCDCFSDKKREEDEEDVDEGEESHYTDCRQYKYCLRCGRRLVNPVYRSRGYGEICFQKMRRYTRKRLF